MELSCLRLEAEELRTEHRNKGKRTDCRDNHDDTCNPSELLEHHTGHTLDHGKRHEHREHCKGRRNNRDTHLLCCMHGRFLWLGTLLQMCRDVLENHDRVVHNHTDRNGERGHRHNVQGVSCSPKIHQGRKKRHRNREHDDECRSPSSEEEVNHEHHDKEGHEDSLLKGIQSVENVVRAVHHSCNGDV